MLWVNQQVNVNAVIWIGCGMDAILNLFLNLDVNHVNCLLQLEQKGACTIKDAMVLYKHTILDKYNDVIGDRECASFRKILEAQLQCRGYRCHYPCKQSGSMYYNDSILTGKAVELVYQLINQTPAKPPVSTEHVCTLVKRQVALLPKSSDFDFRTLFDNK